MTNNNKEYEELKKELNDFSRRLDDMGSEATDRIKDIAKDKTQEMKESLEQIWAQLQKKKDEALNKTKDGAQKVNKYAEENPWHVAMIAGATGFIVGMLSAKSRDRN